MTAAERGPIRIVGVGLLGTSIGLALREHNLDVQLADASPTNVRIAIDYGAGRAAEPGDAPALVFVCVPPDVTADVVAAELAAHPRATVVDVASVKGSILRQLQARDADVTRYLPTHPMAGRERGGPSAGRADLFTGRPWVVCWHAGAVSSDAVEQLIRLMGASPVNMSASDHDRAVALVSHVPQLLASLMAARIGAATTNDVSLAGQGVRDVTRIAASDPELWVQILGANATAVRTVLAEVAADLRNVLTSLEDIDLPGARRQIADTLTAGNAGVSQLPGKHGGSGRFTTLTVLVDDTPGQLARLLTEVGEIGVNLEDLRLEHSPAAQVGLAELSVLPDSAESLRHALESRGWRITG